MCANAHTKGACSPVRDRTLYATLHYPRARRRPAGLCAQWDGAPGRLLRRVQKPFAHSALQTAFRHRCMRVFTRATGSGSWETSPHAAPGGAYHP